jgi:hypothetical protein
VAACHIVRRLNAKDKTAGTYKRLALDTVFAELESAKLRGVKTGYCKAYCLRIA